MPIIIHDFGARYLAEVFVTFEGPEGAGKSTAIAGVKEILEAEGYQVFVTREPGSGEFGKAVRQILLGGLDVIPRAELFLFLADRAQHVESEIRPALEQGKIVICDRYADSTVVYQGYARGMDLELLRELNDLATGSLTPDLTILVDLEPEEGLRRIKDKDRLDSEPIDFHRKVRNGFLAESRIFAGRYRIVNGNQPPRDVIREAADLILSALSAKSIETGEGCQQP